MKLDLLGIEAFLSVAQFGSFQRAAATLHISQTALSHRLRKFEDDLGFQLLARTTRKVALTPAGEYFVPKARRLLGDAQACLSDLRRVGAQRQELITVGCLPTVATIVLPAVLDAFTSRFPDVAVKVFDGISADLTKSVKSGEVELAFTVASTFSPELEFAPLIEQQFVVLCPADHPLAQKSALHAAGLGRSAAIRLGPTDAARLLIDEALGAYGQKMNWKYEVQQMTTAMAFVEAGMGITILPRLSVDPARLVNSVAIALLRPKIAGTFGILTRKNVPLSPAGDTIARLIASFLTSRFSKPLFRVAKRS